MTRGTSIEESFIYPANLKEGNQEKGLEFWEDFLVSIRDYLPDPKANYKRHPQLREILLKPEVYGQKEIRITLLRCVVNATHFEPKQIEIQYKSEERVHCFTDITYRNPRSVDISFTGKTQFF